MDKKTLSVAILGSRGIPNRYGGFESFSEELGTRLVQRGHQVTVYTVRDHPEKAEVWKGVRRVMMPNPEGSLGAFGQFIYDFHCNRHSRREDFDIILHLGYTSDSVWYRLWPEQSLHMVNMDGMEWKRTKFNRAVRAFLAYAERLATLRSQWLVADSKAIQKYLREKYSVPVRYIAYGARVPGSYSPEILQEWGLGQDEYDLIIARMEPENNIEMAIQAKLASGNTQPLVIVGNSTRHRAMLQKKYGRRELIRFPGTLYEEEKVNSLRHFSRLYVHGHSVGGTNPSLLEAMACGCRILAHHNPFNAAVLGEDAHYYSTAQQLTDLFNRFEPGDFEAGKASNLQKLRQEYNWEAVTGAYESLFYDAIGTK